MLSPTIIRKDTPAKINLFLHLRGRREDGYHEIDSLFLPLELKDHLTISILSEAPSNVLCTCPQDKQLDGPENLAARAASLYLKETGISAQIEIILEKQIWVAAGMGGGSSDAAAVLLALEDFFHLSNPEALRRMAKNLGADVPFFLSPTPSRVSGIGDRLLPISGVPSLPLVLAKPYLSLTAKEVYNHLGLAKGSTVETTIPPMEALESPTIESLIESVHNDLEPAGISLCPGVQTLKEILYTNGASCAAMTGSGPTVFGIFYNQRKARVAADKIVKSTGFLAVDSCTVSS